MKQKIVINKDFNDLKKIKVPEAWDEFVLLLYDNNFKAEIFEDMMIIKDVVFHNKGRIGFVKGINEIKFVAFNRTAEQMWMTVLSLFGEQK